MAYRIASGDAVQVNVGSTLVGEVACRLAGVAGLRTVRSAVIGDGDAGGLRSFVAVRADRAHPVLVGAIRGEGRVGERGFGCHSNRGGTAVDAVVVNAGDIVPTQCWGSLGRADRGEPGGCK